MLLLIGNRYACAQCFINPITNMFCVYQQPAPLKIYSCFDSIVAPLPREIQELLDSLTPDTADKDNLFYLYLYVGLRKAGQSDEFSIS